MVDGLERVEAREGRHRKISRSGKDLAYFAPPCFVRHQSDERKEEKTQQFAWKRIIAFTFQKLVEEYDTNPGHRWPSSPYRRPGTTMEQQHHRQHGHPFRLAPQEAIAHYTFRTGSNSSTTLLSPWVFWFLKTWDASRKPTLAE
jgi:hypothetical protein